MDKEESEQCKRYHGWMMSLFEMKNYPIGLPTTILAGFLYMQVERKHEKECVVERK